MWEVVLLKCNETLLRFLYEEGGICTRVFSCSFAVPSVKGMEASRAALLSSPLVRWVAAPRFGVNYKQLCLILKKSCVFLFWAQWQQWCHHFPILYNALRTITSNPAAFLFFEILLGAILLYCFIRDSQPFIFRKNKGYQPKTQTFQLCNDDYCILLFQITGRESSVLYK